MIATILAAILWFGFVIVVGTADKFATYTRKEWVLLYVFAPLVAFTFIGAALIGYFRLKRCQ